ncbi:MAG: anti-sigma factor antagonist [Roseburia sp.]
MENYCECGGGQLVVHIPRELDHHQAGMLKKQADLYIETHGVKQLIFDFAKTEFMDSSGIGMIIGRCRKMGYGGGRVSARNLNARIRKIFVISGLHKLIEMEESESCREETR